MAVKKKKPAARGARGNLKQPTRIKTDVRMSPELMEQVELVCMKLGQTKNGLLVMGAAYLCSMMAPVLKESVSIATAAKLLNAEMERMLQGQAAA